MERLTNVQIQEFLKDFKTNSTVEFLEEGKAKKELIDIAKARGINLKENTDLVGFKCIYGFADKANKNGAILPEKPLLKALPSMIGKPVNIGHQRRYIVGHLLDYRYIQAEKTVIAYGVFYRSNFGEEYDQAKQDFKNKKLNVSFEIWCPKEKKKFLEDNTYELHQIEIAGMAILFHDVEPAFDGAQMLELSKQFQVETPELVYASKYNEDEIITCKDGNCELSKMKTKVEQAESWTCECLKCGHKMTTSSHCNTIKCPSCGGAMRRASRPGTGRPDQSPNAQGKLKCSNCGEEFESGLQENIKCPKCFAIVNKAGQMIYPPQIKDFRLLCPACKINNWLLLAKREDEADVKCLGCAKEYNLSFAKKSNSKVASDFSFLYTSQIRCLQCNTSISVAGFSGSKTRMITCKHCGLEFSYDITHEQYRKIVRINDINSQKENIDSQITKSSEKGGTEMDKEIKEVKTSNEKEHDFLEKSEIENKEEITKRVSTAKSDDKKEEVKTEEKVEEVKVEETLPVKAEEESPKVEDKTEAKKEEVKTEEQPKVEEKTITELAKETSEEASQEEAKEETPKEEKPEEAPKAEEKQEEAKEETPKEEEPEEAPKAEEKVDEPKIEVIETEKDNQIDLGKEEVQKLTQTIERYKSGVRKVAKKYKELRKAMDEKIEFYKTNAKTIIERRAEVGDYEINDEELLNDDKFARAKVEMENAQLRANLETGSEVLGSKASQRDDGWYAKKRAEIDKKAFTIPKK